MAREVGPEPGPRLNPYERAVGNFNRQILAGSTDASSLQKALDAIKKAGSRRVDPQELYANLAALSGIAADLSGNQGQDRARESFLEQQQGFQQTSEQFSQGESSGLILPSQPNRTTGRASG